MHPQGRRRGRTRPGASVRPRAAKARRIGLDCRKSRLGRGPFEEGLPSVVYLAMRAALYTDVSNAVKSTGPGQISLTQGPDPSVGPSPTHFPGLGPSHRYSDQSTSAADAKI